MASLAIAVLLVVVAYGLGRQNMEHLIGKAVAPDMQRGIVDLIRDVLVEVRAAGGLRDDVAPDELATFCLHALSAAGSLPSEAAVRRLVDVTVAGLRPQP